MDVLGQSPLPEKDPHRLQAALSFALSAQPFQAVHAHKLTFPF
jgi:hypothetical protein